jgi:transcription antitermination factor NusG
MMQRGDLVKHTYGASEGILGVVIEVDADRRRKAARHTVKVLTVDGLRRWPVSRVELVNASR